VLAKTGPTPLKPGTRVALAPVRESIEQKDASYVMGDDPERMDAGAVVVAKPVRRAEARGGTSDAGYLYLVLHTQQLPADRWDVLRSSFARPALGAVLAVVALTTLLAALIIAAVTKPLRRLTEAVSTLSQGGLAVNALVPKQMVDVLQAVVILAVSTSVPEVRRLLRARRSTDT